MKAHFKMLKARCAMPALLLALTVVALSSGQAWRAGDLKPRMIKHELGLCA